MWLPEADEQRRHCLAANQAGFLEEDSLFPEEIEAWSAVEELRRVRENIVRAVGKEGGEAVFFMGGADDVGFAGDADGLGGVHEGDAEAAELVDEVEIDGLLAGPDLAGG